MWDTAGVIVLLRVLAILRLMNRGTLFLSREFRTRVLGIRLLVDRCEDRRLIDWPIFFSDLTQIFLRYFVSRAVLLTVNVGL